MYKLESGHSLVIQLEPGYETYDIKCTVLMYINYTLRNEPLITPLIFCDWQYDDIIVVYNSLLLYVTPDSCSSLSYW